MSSSTDPKTTSKINPKPTEEIPSSPNPQDLPKPKPKACYLPRITPIIPGLYLGNLPGSQTTSLLQTHHITAIVSLTTVPNVQNHPATLAAGIPRSRHQWALVIDSSVQDLLIFMTDICDFIDRMAPPVLQSATSLPTPTDPTTQPPIDPEPSHGEAGTGNVLVHCDLGRSRSPTIIIAYLMRKFRIGVDEALRFVQAKQKIKPKEGFLRQLKVWEDTGYQIWGIGGDGKRVAKEAYRVWLGERKVRLREMGF
ncbi:dual specificity protein phosphatase family protein [Aspergillus ibericus CBS 121593]|uniref:protein-tyrosine-phosphatase n=1 Tax=Aspergillus ibericus CBS 121593 TaxID=1448316 RepID=A0A395H4E2_9EURO|nr:phosphatases II [Aspergillus ibericus CBS 121593]RAL02510.1 phosphatases II [Aspergillus ibericus CBS 121593]